MRQATAQAQEAQAEEARTAQRKGRPVQMDLARREAAILDACEDLLVERGANNTTMDAVAQRAGMSKRTLYETFESREKLFAACMARTSRAFFRPLAPEARALPIEERLRLLLTLDERKAYDARPLELFRAIIAEARNYPQLARRTLSEGYHALRRLVADEIEAAIERGELAPVEDRPEALADMLVHMAIDTPVIPLLDPEAGQAPACERERRRDRAIAIFLKGLGAG